VLVVHTDSYGCALHSFTENPSQVCFGLCTWFLDSDPGQ